MIILVNKNTRAPFCVILNEVKEPGSFTTLTTPHHPLTIDA